MADDAVLPLKERLEARRRARAEQAQNGQDKVVEPETRTARNVEDKPESTQADPPPELRRRRFVEPAPKPAEAVEVSKSDAPPEPSQRRKIVNEAGEEVPPPVMPVTTQTADSAETIKPETPPTRTERVMEQARQVSNEIVVALLESMRAGEQLLITRDDEKVWKIVMPTSATGYYQVRVNPAGVPKVEVERKVPDNPGRTPAGFEASMMNPDYIKFQEDWAKMNMEQKAAMADELKVKVPEWAYKDDRTLNMQLSMVIQKVKGLEKWQPKYSTVEARKLAKEKATRGLEW